MSEKMRSKIKSFFSKIKEKLNKLKQMKHWHGVEISLMAVCSFVLMFFIIGIMPDLFVHAEEKLPVEYAVATTAEETTEEQTEPETETEVETEAETTVETTTKKIVAPKVKNVPKGEKNDKEDSKNSGNNSAGTASPDKSPVISDNFKGDEVNNSTDSELLDLQYVNKNNLTGYTSINDTLYCFDNNHIPQSGFKTINNIRYYFNKYGAQASKVGIDVSNHNGNINWKKVKAAGIDFAIIRVGYRGYGSEGNVKLDYKFEENMSGAIANGISVGVYFYSQATNVEEALYEAGVAITYAKKYKITYPIYFDTEYARGDRTGRADRISKSVRTDAAVAFCEAVKNAGFKAGVYASKSFFTDELNFSRISSYHIWVAHYTSGTTNFKYNYRVWQYTDKGRVDGIPNDTDINIALYDYKTGSDMSKIGSNLILFDSDEGINEAKNCEKSIELYEQYKTEKTYNDAYLKISQLSNGTARDKLLDLLNKKKKQYGFVTIPETTVANAVDNAQNTTL